MLACFIDLECHIDKGCLSGGEGEVRVREELDEDIRDEIVGLCFLFLPLKISCAFFLYLLHNVQTLLALLIRIIKMLNEQKGIL